jgi:hypothetical protein
MSMDPAIQLSGVEGVRAAFLEKALELGQVELGQIVGGGWHLSLAFSAGCEHRIVAFPFQVATAKARVL